MQNDYNLIVDHLESIIRDYKDSQVTGWFSCEINREKNFKLEASALWATCKEDGRASHFTLNDGKATLLIFNIFTGEIINYATATVQGRMDKMYFILLDMDKRFN